MMPNRYEREQPARPIPQPAEWGSPYRYLNDQIGNRSKSYHTPWTQPTHSNVRAIPPPRRRWPPPPSVEDEVIALAKELNSEDKHGTIETADDAVVVRGAVDQQPIILDVATSATQSQAHDFASGRSSVRTKSSSDSLEPGTPANTLDKNPDRRYIYIPHEGTGIPISYDDSESERCFTVSRETYPQSRKDITPLQTNVDDARGRTPADSSRRDPLPYAYTPSSSKGRYSGESFLSPDVMYSPAWNQNGPRIKDTVRSERGQSAEPRSQEYHRSHQGGRGFPGPAPVRPSVVRHQSAMADPGSRVRAEQLNHASDLESSSDETDFETYSQRHPARANPANATRPSVHRASNSYHEGQTSMLVKDQIQSPKRRTISPPRRPLPAYDNRTPLTTVSSPSGLTPQTALDIDAYFASNLLKQRNRPYRSSPLTSPFSSPPRSPKTEAEKPSNDTPPNGLRSRPMSRPASPLSIHPPPNHLSHLDSNRSTLPDPRWDGYGSRRSSPLPSPEIRDRDYTPRPGPRLAVHAPPPASAGRSYSYAGDGHARSTSRPSSPTRLSTLQSESRPGSREPYQRTSSYVEPKHQMPPMTTSSRPPPSLPPRSRPTTPKLSVDVASPQPPLPPCPRPAFVSSYNDWNILIGRPNFDVCPSCMENVVGSKYRAWFARAPSKPPGMKTKCNFSSPWVRIAWLKSLKEKREKPDILYAIASITEKPCPGKMGLIRAWYSLPDPDTGKPTPNFNVCPYCVRAVECIFPSLRGVFRYDQKQKPTKQRACDLRCDSKRYAGYIDRLDAIANKADAERRSPSMRRFADYAREMTLTRGCSKDDMVLDQAWHIIPQVPQFTVCEECYDEVVWPEIDAGSPLAAKFNRSMQIVGPGGVSCQLYSLRMRHVFKDGVRNNDLTYVQQHAVKRHTMERSLQARHAQARAYGDHEEIARIVQEWRKWE